MVFEPFFGLFAGVFGVIVLLIYDVLRRFAIMGKAFLKFIIQNLDEKVPIHPTINPACSITDSPPNFTVPSTSLSLSPSPALFQTHFLPSDLRQLILVSSDHTTLSSPPESNLCAWLQSPFSPSYAFVTEGAFSSSPLPSYQFSWGVCTLSGEWQVGWW